tara:strand:+ start:238 stop:423 length:186 start_codon:yes stop_codon:yes gene_type:complete
VSKLQDAIDKAWDEAEEIHSGLEEMTDEEVIETKEALKDRAYNIMCVIDEYVKSTVVQEGE